jgi:hypothetical protein
LPEEQSVSPLQVLLQAPVPQTYLPQLLEVAVEQLPLPEQVGAGVKVVPVQLGLPHVTEVAAWVQAPAPLQVPVLPQVVVTAHCPVGAAWPAEMFEQLPSPFRLQAWQVGQLALPQQTPLVQKPLMHWFEMLQAWPFGFSAQLLVVPEPGQVKGATHSASLAQVVRQALVLPHWKLPGQAEAVGAAQAPEPLQCETGVNVAPVQVAVPHETEVPPAWQCPAPSQAPVKPQGGLGVHWLCGSGVLAATLAQLPALPVTLQAWQVGQAVALQQTPSTQLLPVKQSPVAVQVWPRRFLFPHRLVLGSQMFGDWQSASEAQAALQAVVPLQT